MVTHKSCEAAFAGMPDVATAHHGDIAGTTARRRSRSLHHRWRIARAGRSGGRHIGHVTRDALLATGAAAIAPTCFRTAKAAERAPAETPATSPTWPRSRSSGPMQRP